jgi:hypothetical protein
MPKRTRTSWGAVVEELWRIDAVACIYLYKDSDENEEPTRRGGITKLQDTAHSRTWASIFFLYIAWPFLGWIKRRMYSIIRKKIEWNNCCVTAGSLPHMYRICLQDFLSSQQKTRQFSSTQLHCVGYKYQGGSFTRRKILFKLMFLILF